MRLRVRLRLRPRLRVRLRVGLRVRLRVRLSVRVRVVAAVRLEKGQGREERRAKGGPRCDGRQGRRRWRVGRQRWADQCGEEDGGAL